VNYFEFHIGDYAAATQHLSDEEDLVYRRLLDAYYRDERPIPSDLRLACRLARARTDAMREAVEVVLREFFVLAEDGWRSKRADEVIARHHAFMERQRANGRKTAEKRWGSQSVATATEYVAAATPPLPNSVTVGLPPTSHFPLPTTQDGSNEPSGKTARSRAPVLLTPQFDPSIVPGLDLAAWHDWVAYRAKRKPAIKAVSMPAAAREMAKLGPLQRAAVDHSIANGYQGLIAPKDGPNGRRIEVPRPTRYEQLTAGLDRQIAADQEALAVNGGPVRGALAGDVRPRAVAALAEPGRGAYRRAGEAGAADDPQGGFDAPAIAS
jgi:uncharacterized protein YdaU (DUF1376 family)